MHAGADPPLKLSPCSCSMSLFLILQLCLQKQLLEGFSSFNKGFLLNNDMYVKNVLQMASCIERYVFCIFLLLLLFLETIPGLGIEDLLDDFVTFFIAGRALLMDRSIDQSVSQSSFFFHRNPIQLERK